MLNNFVKTKNVFRSEELIKSLQSRGGGVPGLGMFYSDPGIGKTETCLWLVGRKGSNIKYIRAKANITPRWLMEMIVSELGEEPVYRYSDLFNQAVKLLMGRDTMLMVDEIDFCCHDSRVLESLRDLHDEVGVPIVLIGMGQVDKKIKRHPHFYSRISQIYKFQPLDHADVADAAQQLCEVALSDDACKALSDTCEGSFRSLKIIVNHIEAFARRNNLKTVETKHIADLNWRSK